MLRPGKIFGLVSLLLVVSCSIVKDTDVTSLDQFNKLTLKSFDIIENDGNVSTYSATLKFDSVINRTTKSKFGSYHLTRHLGFSLPWLGGRKMQILGDNLPTQQHSDLISIYYRSDGKPYFFEIDVGDSTVAFYRLLYYSSGQLASFTTFIDPIDGKPAIRVTKDTLFYSSTSTSSSSNNLTGITRKFDGAGTFALQYNNCTNCGFSGLNQFSPTGTISGGNGYNIQSGGCENSNGNTGYSCGNLQYQTSGISGSYNVNIQLVESLGKISQMTFSDSPAGTDVYYLHPMMLLQDVVPQADELLWIYAVDWWVYRQANSGGTQSGSNRSAQIIFNYGK